jgi:hypothetical protein
MHMGMHEVSSLLVKIVAGLLGQVAAVQCLLWDFPFLADAAHLWGIANATRAEGG